LVPSSDEEYIYPWAYSPWEAYTYGINPLMVSLLFTPLTGW